MEFRMENDTMGTVRVARDAYYGAQTQRAVDNFPISGVTMPLELLHALALIKKSAARINNENGVLTTQIADTIIVAAQEVMDGKFDDQFVVDVFQTGSGTSTNMNMNEVIATRVNELITGKKDGKTPVHPNDHVNAGQSSNDTIPTAMHIAALQGIKFKLIPALHRLHACLQSKADAFKDINKIGRTHLQDAVPMTLGQEFSGYSRQVELGILRLNALEDRLSELALGGTAVGTGLNAQPGFAAKVIALIATETKISFKEAVNHFEAQASKDACAEASGALRTVGGSLAKIANDIRWLASGPRCGLGEINLPSLQPGSSIMPGKINPVIPESVIQVSAQIMGNDTTIMQSQSGIFELNLMMPVIIHNLMQSINLLANASQVLADNCIDGITANRRVCEDYIEKSLAMVTGLIPHIGYDRAAQIAKKAWKTGQTIRQVLLEDEILPPEVIEKSLQI